MVVCRAGTYQPLIGCRCSHCSMMLRDSAGRLALQQGERRLAGPGSSLCKRGVRGAALSRAGQAQERLQQAPQLSQTPQNMVCCLR